MTAKTVRLNEASLYSPFSLVYQGLHVQEKLLLTVNNRICIFVMSLNADDGKLELTAECSHTGKVVALYMDVRGNKIVVGDLMRSLALYHYLPEEQRLELVAEEYEGTCHRW